MGGRAKGFCAEGRKSSWTEDYARDDHAAVRTGAFGAYGDRDACWLNNEYEFDYRGTDIEGKRHDSGCRPVGTDDGKRGVALRHFGWVGNGLPDFVRQCEWVGRGIADLRRREYGDWVERTIHNLLYVDGDLFRIHDIQFGGGDANDGGIHTLGVAFIE